MNLRAELAHKDIACADTLAGVNLDAAMLSRAVTPIAR
jgi:hypothetical protein